MQTKRNKKIKMSNYVWYVGYGSNLLSERFHYYITGGKFPWGGKENQRCREDPSLPIDDKPFKFNHRLYFAISAPGWKNGGVAFVSKTPDANSLTYGRKWKVSQTQFSHIASEEGKVYEELLLGHDEQGIPIKTLTNSGELDRTKPSTEYVKTIIAGLKETHHLDDKTICNYLINTDGIKGEYGEQEILEICSSV